MKNKNLSSAPHKTSALKIGIIANCQSQTLAVLTQHMLPQAKTTVLDLSSPDSRDETYRKQLCESMHDHDFIFIQTHDLTYSNEQAMRESCRGQVIKIANFFFRGLHPDMCMLGDFDSRVDIFSRNHSVVILDGYLRGLSAQQTIESFTSENYKRLGLFDAWEASLSEMRTRDTSVDFPASHLIEESVRRYPAFLTMNHPTLRLMYDYFHGVLNGLEVKHNQIDISRIADPMNVHDITGVMDIVCEHHNLPYRTSETWRIEAFNRQYLKIPQLVEAFFRAYQDIAIEDLCIHSPLDMVAKFKENASLRFLIDTHVVPKPKQPRSAPQPSPQEVKWLQAQAQKEALRKELSHAEFIAALDVKITAAEILSTEHPNFEETLTLLNRTNAFNTAEKQWTQQECETYFSQGNGFYAFKVKDCLWDHGLAGCAVISRNIIEQFVMRSAVIDMGVEQQVIADIAHHMQEAGAQQICGNITELKYNFPCHNLYSKCGFTKKDNQWIKPL